MTKPTKKNADEVMALRQELKDMAWVSVLNDDDTYSGLDGAWIAPTTPAEVAALDSGEDVAETIGHSRVNLRALLDFAIDHGFLLSP